MRRLLLLVMKRAWTQGVFFIYQMRFERNPKTRNLKLENGEPIYDPNVFIEFENLVRTFGVNAQLFPPKNGKWSLNKEQLKKMAEISQIQAVTKQMENDQAFDELLADLAELTTPLEPVDMKTISEHTAYQPDVLESSKVLPEPKPIDDPQIQRIETTLADIKTALEGLHEAVRGLARSRNKPNS